MSAKKESMYDKFLNRIHKDKVGDPQIIIGGEIVLVAIVLFWKFFDSPLSEILKIENNILYLVAIIGLSVVMLSGIVVLIYGIIAKCKNK